MANQLITVEQAARDLNDSLQAAIKEFRAEGIPDEEIERALNDIFARWGCFPAEAE